MSLAAYGPDDREILSRHVTNADSNVYCITNLPEEVVAVVFAYVSRSERSFRDNLLRLLKDEAVLQGASGVAPHYEAATERAADFHARWVVGYGHSSVAEHAVAHVGVERVSRLASSELELANRFLSFTEYSQRYQKPRRGCFYQPPELPAHMAEPFAAAMHALYDAYESLYEGLVDYLALSAPGLEGESPSARQARLCRVAFEDARYALPLATLTSLGLTGNGRALRDCIALLRASPLPEVRGMADQIDHEVSKVLPTLLRHATPSAYQLTWRDLLPPSRPAPEPGAAVGQPRLLNYTGYQTPDPEATALRVMAAAMMAEPEAPDDAAVESCLKASLTALGPHDVAPEAFHWVRYDFALAISEAAWHQLQRHCRAMHFQWGPPEVTNGYTVPQNVADAGLTDILAAAVATAERVYEELKDSAPELAGYAVTNAHRRRVRVELDLQQLYHLVNLRTTEQAQWDIRQVVSRLWDQVLEVHPRLAQRACRRGI